MKLISYKLRNFSFYKILRNLYFALIDIYGTISFLLYKKYTKHIVYLRDKNFATFFGYHDKIPFSADGFKVLAMSVETTDKKPESECTPMNLGYFTKNEIGDFSEFIQFAETTTWCWQQGCMLQWHPTEPNKWVIFNALVNGDYGSVVFDIDKGLPVKKYSHPIYSIDPTGINAVTLNFSRLGIRRPGYGYTLLPNTTSGNSAPEDDGLFIFSLTNSDKEILVSLAELAIEVDILHMQHYVNHATFSPDGKQIAFFHLWVDSNSNHTMRFFSYDINTCERFLLEDKRKVSHYCWINSKEILATVFNKYSNTWEYLTYTTDKAYQAQTTSIDLKTDGHPMRSPTDKNIFVTDSRINRRRKDSIILFNEETNKTATIANFFIPVVYKGQVRCDLHPRWDRHGRLIMADVVLNRKRAIAIVKAEPFINRIMPNR